MKCKNMLLFFFCCVISTALSAQDFYDHQENKIDLEVDESQINSDSDQDFEAIALKKEVPFTLAIPEVRSSQPNLDLNPIIAHHDDLIIYIRDANNHSYRLSPSNFEVNFDTNSDFSFLGVFGDVIVLNCNTASPYLNLSFDARIKNASGWGPWKNFTYFLQGYYP